MVHWRWYIIGPTIRHDKHNTSLTAFPFFIALATCFQNNLLIMRWMQAFVQQWSSEANILSGIPSHCSPLCWVLGQKIQQMKAMNHKLCASRMISQVTLRRHSETIWLVHDPPVLYWTCQPLSFHKNPALYCNQGYLFPWKRLHSSPGQVLPAFLQVMRLMTKEI